MKYLFTTSLFVFALTACKKENANTQTPKTLSQVEQGLIGTWDHDSTIQFNPDGSPFTVMPMCSNASITFTDVENTTPGAQYWDYNFAYNMACTNIPSGWALRGDTVWAANLNYKLIELTDHKLVLQQGNVTALIHFSR